METEVPRMEAYWSISLCVPGEEIHAGQVEPLQCVGKGRGEEPVLVDALAVLVHRHEAGRLQGRHQCRYHGGVALRPLRRTS